MISLLSLMSVDEVATRLKIPPKEVRNLCATGNFPGARRPGRHWVIPEASLACFDGLPKEHEFPGVWSGRRPARDNSVVYFIQAECGGLIKIGRTCKLAARLALAQSLCPIPLRVITTTPGYFEAEKHLHRRFKAGRRHGEWFEPTDDLLEFIASLSKRAAP